MTKLKHLLVPVDGSEGSMKAASLGGDLARKLDAELTVLLVHDEQAVVSHAWQAGDNDSGLASPLGSVEAARAAMEEASLQNELADAKTAVGDVSAGLKLVQIWGHPARDICLYAKENDADMIIMGSQGRTGLKRLLLGSVSHAVVNTADRAVTIVR
jgi:nucleotide-binding universal stress UspA family protein